ncbi:decapping enzyme [Niveomyces insectorum RCEF 264]|uniref:Decapping enzyme n=1 Tax=Niveomyces insectorum RCEF 264 TaxID=1081102 RepID=A0A167PDB5_9HYPO|nr:decapping enzyme [Niveomyces insectorum RCEF 264]
MSRQTPRKARHQNNNPNASHGDSQRGNQHGQQSHLAVPPSDLEAEANNTSDAVSDDPELHVHRGTETLTSMNLHVLRRYEPTIRSILAVAASTVVYVLNYATGGWEKPEPPVEGTLFLCEQEPLAVGQYVVPRACVFLLNRKGLMNVVVDLAQVNVAEVTADLLTLRIDEAAPAAGEGGTERANGAENGSTNTPPVLGFWIHGGAAVHDDTQFNPALVVECWRNIRTALEQTLGTAELAETAGFLEAAATVTKMEIATRGNDPDGIATRAIGPQPGIKELVAMALNPVGGGGGGHAAAGAVGT